MSVALYRSVLTLHILTAASSSWDYDNQDQWGGQCNNTIIQQSPINIDTNDLQSCDSNISSLQWELDDVEQFDIENVLHYYTLNFRSSTHYPFGTLTNNFVTSSDEHKTYLLDSFHIHWDSEHTIDGDQTALEMHFVHYSSDYDNITHAIHDAVHEIPSDVYTLAVVSVLFEFGKENDFFTKVIDSDQFSKLQSVDNDIRIDGADIHQLIPKKYEFYHYKGSFTTPPCYTIGQWHILKKKMSISKAQMSVLRTIRDHSNNTINGNYRDSQDIISDVHLCGEESQPSSSKKQQCTDDVVKCRKNVVCSVDCFVNNSCNGNIKIDGSDATDVTVKCAAKGECKGVTEIYCGSGVCKITCSKSNSCEDTTVYVEDSDSVECVPQKYCNNVKIKKTGNGHSAGNVEEDANDNPLYRANSSDNNSLLHIIAVLVVAVVASLIVVGLSTIVFFYCTRRKQFRTGHIMVNTEDNDEEVEDYMLDDIVNINLRNTTTSTVFE